MIKSVHKALSMLDVLGLEDLRAQGVPLKELARRIGAPNNTACSILKTMAEAGYVTQNSDGHYLLGEVCLQMADLRRMAGSEGQAAYIPIVDRIQAELNELVSLVTLAGGHRIVLALRNSSHTVRIDPVAMEPNSLYDAVAPSGRVLVAFAEPWQRRLVVETVGYPGSRWDDIEDDRSLALACRNIREQGFEHTVVEQKGVAVFAVPVLSESGRLLAALGCGVPTFRCDAERGPEVIHALQDAARDVAGALRSVHIQSHPFLEPTTP